MDKSTWIILALLLPLGIAVGVYWGTNLWWTESPEQSVVAASGKPASDSSGSSETPDQEQQPVVTAPTAPATAQAPIPPPALPSSKNMASTAPQTNDVASQKADRTQSAAPPALPPPSEDELWQSASASNNASAYENYLKQYPKGRNAAIAKRKLMREQPKAAMIAPPGISPPLPQQDAKRKAAPDTTPKTVVPSAEEELWTKAASINKAPAYEAYLDKYPNGRHAPIAKDKLASIKPAEPAALPSPPPTAVAQPAPETTVPAERNAPTEADLQASIKPLEPEPSAPSVPEQIAPEPTPTPTPEPEPPVATSKKHLKLDDQTLIGDFSVNPETGIVSGTGKIIWADGRQFEGTLVRGIKEGKGKFIWNNGQRYNGDWARDLPNGKGTIVFANGDRYTGDVTDGVPNGQGTTRFKSGDVYSGAWVKGKSHGYGRYTWVNGSYWEGEFKDDKRTEDGKIVSADGASGASASTSTPPAVMGEAQDSERSASNKVPVDQ